MLPRSIVLFARMAHTHTHTLSHTSYKTSSASPPSQIHTHQVRPHTHTHAISTRTCVKHTQPQQQQQQQLHTHHIQKTISESVEFVGVGLHSGCPAHITLLPAKAHTGICFVLPPNGEVVGSDAAQDANGSHIRACYTNVLDTSLSTTLCPPSLIPPPLRRAALWAIRTSHTAPLYESDTFGSTSDPSIQTSHSGPVQTHGSRSAPLHESDTNGSETHPGPVQTYGSESAPLWSSWRRLLVAICGRVFLPQGAIATVEHLMAALSGLGIDNVRIQVSAGGGNPPYAGNTPRGVIPPGRVFEVPIMDGSSRDFVKSLRPLVVHVPNGEVRRVVHVRRHVSVQMSGSRSATLSPLCEGDFPPSRCVGGISPAPRKDALWIEVMADFGDKIRGGAQLFCMERGEFAGGLDIFGGEGGSSNEGYPPPREGGDLPGGRGAACARTFCFVEDLEYMRKRGLARGGSLENAVVYRDGLPINQEGLRYPDEVARHKALDVLGDLSLGGMLVGHYRGIKPGHAINLKLLKKLFSDPKNFSFE